MPAGDARELFKQADHLYKSARYDEALQILNELNEKFPNTKNVLYPRALCLAQIGRLDEAERICNHLESYFQDKRCPDLRNKLSAKKEQIGATAAGPMNVDDGGDMAIPQVDPSAIDQFDLGSSAVPPPPPNYNAAQAGGGSSYLKYALIAIGVIIVAAVIIVPLANYDGSSQPGGGGGAPLTDEERYARFNFALYAVFIPLSLILMPFPLYFSLRLTERLPHDDFWPDYRTTWVSSFIATLIAIIPCIGPILGIYYLYRSYEMNAVGVILLIVFNVTLTIIFLVGAFFAGVGFALSNMPAA